MCMAYSMKKTYILLLFVSSIAFGKDTTLKNKVPTQNIPNKVIQKTDTIKSTPKDTLHITLPSCSEKTNVYFIKEPTKENLFKDVLPILTLLLGIAINKILDWLKDKRKITKAGERWVAEIRSLESPIVQQMELLQKSLDNEQKKEYSFLNLQIVPVLDCEIFKSLDKSDLLKFIQRHKKNNYAEAVKISNQTHGFVSIMIRLYSTLQEKYKEYTQGVSKHTATVNENLQALSKAFAYYGAAIEQEIQADPSGDARVKPISDLFDKYIEPHRDDGAYDLFELNDYFFQPLTKIFAMLRHDQRSYPMADATLACINAIKGIRMEKHYWAENTKSIIELYQEQLKALPTLANNVENRKA